MVQLRSPLSVQYILFPQESNRGLAAQKAEFVPSWLDTDRKVYEGNCKYFWIGIPAK